MPSKDKQIVDQIEKLINTQIITPLNSKQVPQFVIPERSKHNTIYDKVLRLGKETYIRSATDLGQVKSFAQLVQVAAAIHQALSDGVHPTLRDIFYSVRHTIENTNTEAFEGQGESNTCIEELETILNFTREEIGVMSKAKGLVMGDFVLTDAEKNKSLQISSSPVPVVISPLIDRIQIGAVKAKYVLIVEKDAVFQTLHDMNFWEKNQCIIMTGSGQPDRATRRLAHRFSEEHKLPVYVLTDSDPYGWDIFSKYKVGSVSLAYQVDKLVTPAAKFLGVSCSDLYTFKIPKTAVIKASDTDLKRAQDLKEDAWFKDDFWQKELDLFLKYKEKCEIEAFSKFGFRYLAEEYLPRKLKEVSS